MTRHHCDTCGYYEEGVGVVFEDCHLSTVQLTLNEKVSRRPSTPFMIDHEYQLCPKCYAKLHAMVEVFIRVIKENKE